MRGTIPAGFEHLGLLSAELALAIVDGTHVRAGMYRIGDLGNGQENEGNQRREGRSHLATMYDA